MAKAFNLKILTPEGIIFQGKANSFQTTTDGGSIGIYADMIPTVALIKPCLSSIEVENKFTQYVLIGGLLNAHGDDVVVFSDYCFEKDKVNLENLKKQINEWTELKKQAKTESQATLLTTKINLNTQIMEIISQK